jgi:disulfide bond formation protein DsbB
MTEVWVSGEQVDLFFAIVAVAGLLGTLTVVAFAVVGLFSGGAKRSLVAARKSIAGSELLLAAGISVSATAGSLYYSQIRHFEPCQLCWYQRIFMYPTAVLLVVALVKGDTLVRRYVLPLAAIGASISIYHNYIQIFPDLDAGGACGFGPSCSGKYINVFNNVSIPVMALSAFFMIIVVTIALYLNERDGTRR